MFYSAELGFMREILNKYHIQTTIFDADDSIANVFAHSLNEFVYQNKNISFNNAFPDIKENAIYKFTDILSCYYYFLMLPQNDEKLILAIGPYLNQEPTDSFLLERAELLKIEPKDMGNLEHFLGNVPLISDETHIFAIIGTFADRIWGGTERYTFKDLKEDGAYSFHGFDFKNTNNQTENVAALNMRIMEQRYNYENELMAAVSQGLSHKIELLLTNVSQIAFEKRTTDTLRNAKNYCIIMNTLLRKSAENGGVHPIYIDSVSSGFAKKIETLSNSANVGKFMVEMLKSYCSLVKNHSINKFSPAVQKTIIAIDSDLTADLSLKTMAKFNNVSAGYLSALFRKETGQTLTDFVNNRRIKMAKKLLETTNLQVQTIAQHCGILDLQYFSKMFKVKTGLTPKEYRENTI